MKTQRKGTDKYTCISVSAETYARLMAKFGRGKIGPGVDRLITKYLDDVAPGLVQ